MRSTNLKEQGMGEHNFGDYIVFVDESGDQSLKSVNANYPVFVLSFCIFEKTHYYTHVVPEILRFKFDFFGSDIPILHEREIRKREGDFNILCVMTSAANSSTDSIKSWSNPNTQ